MPLRLSSIFYSISFNLSSVLLDTYQTFLIKSAETDPSGRVNGRDLFSGTFYEKTLMKGYKTEQPLKERLKDTA